MKKYWVKEWLFLIIRLYVGWQWLEAGYAKFASGEWLGSGSGAALTKFLNAAILKTEGAHPDVQLWYAKFLQIAVLSHPAIWSNVVACGELAVGVALILGAFTGLAAFFGAFMNLNYMLAGSLSINPILFTLSILMIISWKTAGLIGLDYFILPKLYEKL